MRSQSFASSIHCFPSSPGVLPTGTMPSSTSFLLMAGSCIARRTSSAQRSAMAPGVPAGAASAK